MRQTVRYGMLSSRRWVAGVVPDAVIRLISRLRHDGSGCERHPIAERDMPRGNRFSSLPKGRGDQTSLTRCLRQRFAYRSWTTP